MTKEEIISLFDDVGIVYRHGPDNSWKEAEYEYTLCPNYAISVSAWDSFGDYSEEEFLQSAIDAIIKDMELQVSTIQAEIRFMQELQKQIQK